MALRSASLSMTQTKKKRKRKRKKEEKEDLTRSAMASMDSLLLSTSEAAPSYLSAAEYYPRKLGPKPDVVPTGVTERKVGPLDKPDMVAVDVINLSEHEMPPMHKKKHDTYVLGTIHPFRTTHRSLPGKLMQELRLVTSDRRSWRILLFGFLNLMCTACLLVWCSSTNSMALTAYTYLTIFELFSLVTCLISSWVSMKKPSQVFSFGFDRLEVLAVFASTVLVQLGALFILKESGRLLVGTFVALLFNLLTLMSVRNKPFACVSQAASSSWLQEHVADLSRSLCGVIPGLSSVLLPRMNPFVLINLAGALSLCVTYMLIEINDYNSVDTASAVAIALMTFGTMYPMSVYSGKVLLQTTPSHVIGQLDKLLREVSTLDGVLEVRNEHFWTLGFGSLAGSAHVRIRRDANEQLVLAHVTNRLLPLVSTLTVQIFKDDWTRPLLTGALSPSTGPPPRPAAEGSSLPPALLDLDPLTSTPSKPSSPPPEFAFDTPGRNAQPVLLPATAHRHQHIHGPYRGLVYAGAPGLTRPIAAPVSLRVPGLGGGYGLGGADYRTSGSSAHHYRHYTPK
uniref:Solute carrier family 30 member 6 n=1 Tax=Hippocampus comes TaxID=109280 RepID=A0A3Q2YES8_HIPCM